MLIKCCDILKKEVRSGVMQTYVTLSNIKLRVVMLSIIVWCIILMSVIMLYVNTECQNAEY